MLALYEGLKRAQRSRLEDQRGTEINFEMPDFLKVGIENNIFVFILFLYLIVSFMLRIKKIKQWIPIKSNVNQLD